MLSPLIVRIAVTAIAGLCCAAASAQTLYKLIDKNGKVTYSESKPKTFDGEVIRIDIDPNANTATLPKLKGNAGDPGRVNRERNDGASGVAEAEARSAYARNRLENAKKALQDARDNPSPGEVEILGNKGGGVRFIETEAYQKRIEGLEGAVKRAEEELRRVEEGR